MGVVALQASAGAQQVLWRFRMETDYVPHRPAVGADGTVYVADLHARLYALRPDDGSLLWSFDASLGTDALTEGPVAVTPDGTIVVAANPLGQTTNLVAVNPDGSLRWVHTDCCSAGCISGPNVGPDGHVYAVFDSGGAGAVSLTQDGQLRWETTGAPLMWEYGAIGAEVVFGRSSASGPVDQMVTAFDRNFDDHVWATHLDGSQNFAVPTSSTQSVFGQQQAQPAVGPDGTIYLCEFHSVLGWGLQAFAGDDGARVWRFNPDINATVTPPDVGADGTIYFSRDLSRIHAVNPDGTESWAHIDPGVIDRGAIVGPGDDMLVYCGRLDFGQAGTVTARSTEDGELLWRVTFPDEAGGHLTPSTRALFHPDGSVVYVGVDNLGQTHGQPYCYLYAIATDCSAPEPYCVGAPNSAGAGARIGWAGSTSIVANDFTLTASESIPNQFGMFFYGPLETQIPFGDGFRCVGGSLFRLLPPRAADANGDASRQVDFTQPPASSGPGKIDPGSTWKFQYWYRDPAAGGSGFNLSDALSVLFCS